MFDNRYWGEYEYYESPRNGRCDSCFITGCGDTCYSDSDCCSNRCAMGQCTNRTAGSEETGCQQGVNHAQLARQHTAPHGTTSFPCQCNLGVRAGVLRS